MLVYTIGHSRHKINEFIDLLRKNNINCVCDVRSTPFSKFAEQFNQDSLKKSLQDNDIVYLYFGEEFGARRKEQELITNGVVDFEKVSKSEKFKSGIKRLEKGAKKGYTIALMCSEKDPIDCHRTILVARNLSLNGFEVNHILDTGSQISQKDVDEQLLKKYFPKRNQVSLFEEDVPIDYLLEAYKKANQDIGYKGEGDDE